MKASLIYILSHLANRLWAHVFYAQTYGLCNMKTSYVYKVSNSVFSEFKVVFKISIWPKGGDKRITTSDLQILAELNFDRIFMS